jgi:predicted TIM-barrel fold metal-dependent hydrolase
VTRTGAHVIDSHAHVIADDPRYPFAPRQGTLPAWLPERHQTAEKLLASMDASGVDQAVLVQYASVHGYDCSYVIDTVAAHPERFVAVCAIDPVSQEAPQHMTGWVDRGAAGLRIAAPGGSDKGPGWVENDAIWRAASDLAVPLCVHFMVATQAAGVPVLRRMMERYADVTVVLDHVANPAWGDGAPSYGLGPVLAMSHLKLVLKFATINLERLHAANVDASTALRVILDTFGAERVIWGSDAPNTPGVYGDMVEMMERLLESVSASERASILGGTAQRVYPSLATRAQRVTQAASGGQ